MSGPIVDIKPKTPAPSEEHDHSRWTVAELLAGAQRQETVTVDGKTFLVRPLTSFELADINRAFKDRAEERMAATVAKCTLDPHIDYEQVQRMLPGHVQRVYLAIMDISGYTERSRKNLSS